MTSNKIKLIKLFPNEYPITVEISSTDYSLRKAVNSCNYRKAQIRAIDEDACVIFNKDLSFSGLQPNRMIADDILCGVVYIAGISDDGRLRSLDDDEIERYSQLFYEPESYTFDEAQSANLTYLYKAQLERFAVNA